MTTKKVFRIAFFVFAGLFAACICFAIAFETSGKTKPEQAESRHIKTHYELPKLIPAAWYVGK